MSNKTIACIAGARPNFMKIAPILHEIARRGHFTSRLIHTGQHFSPEMSDLFFRDLEIPEPDEHMGIGGGTSIEQTALVMRGLERSFLDHRPALVLVVGDVTSTMAAALVAAKMQIPLAHVEAGLRSFDREMPEELNRVVTDALSDYLFITEPSGVQNLRNESVSNDRIFLVGNVMIDTLLRFRDRAMQSDVLERFGLRPKSYAVVTLHRPSNVDDEAQLGHLALVLKRIAGRLPVVFPVHPRTRARLQNAGFSTDDVILIPPQGYLDFLRLMADARIVLTDSGGVQEETTILQVPCLTLRENTERPVTIEVGTNRLVGTNPNRVFSATLEVLDGPPIKAQVPSLWDGQASRRILDILEEKLCDWTDRNS